MAERIQGVFERVLALLPLAPALVQPAALIKLPPSLTSL
jgi:hypothetical protein